MVVTDKVTETGNICLFLNAFTISNTVCNVHNWVKHKIQICLN